MEPVINSYRDARKDPYHIFQPAVLNGRPIKVINQGSMCCYIVPPHMTDHIYKQRSSLDKEDVTEILAKHTKKTDKFRKERLQHILPLESLLQEEQDQASALWQAKQTVPVIAKVYNANHAYRLPGIFETSNVSPNAKADQAAQVALKQSLMVFDFYLKNFRRNSIDGHNTPLYSSVHYGNNYENAFYNGQYMVYGDGSEYFAPFVNFLDIVAHEMTHGVTGNLLDYEDEAGALNEHLSDVFGELNDQYAKKHTAKQAKWKIGWSEDMGGLMTDGNKTFPLRSMAAPGTAYDTEDLGKDPQPAHYQDRYKGTEDNGGVHINSGIPNHAFYIAATEIDGYAWKTVGLVWYVTIQSKLILPNATIKQFAEATLIVSKKLFGRDDKVTQAILKGWKTVGVLN